MISRTWSSRPGTRQPGRRDPATSRVHRPAARRMVDPYETTRRSRQIGSGERSSVMKLSAIPRRNGWATPQDLQVSAERSTAEGDKPGSGVRWIRSYVLDEES